MLLFRWCPARSHEYVASVGDVGVASLGIPGSASLLGEALSAEQAACAFAATRHVAIDRCRPSRQLRQQLRAVLAVGGLRRLARLTAAFGTAADVSDVVSLLTLVSARCGGLLDLSLVRVGTAEPRLLPAVDDSPVACHLGRRASRTVRSVRTGQAAAADMAAMILGLSDVAGGLPPLRVLRLVDAYTVHPTHGAIVSAFDTRATQPFSALPAVLHSSLRALTITNVRGDGQMFACGVLRALRALRRLELPGIEDVPLELPPALQHLTVGAATPRGLVRAAAVSSLTTLAFRSLDIFPARARPTDTDALLILEDWDVLGFGVTCQCVAYATGRGLLPRRLCFWKVGLMWGFDVLRRAWSERWARDA